MQKNDAQISGFALLEKAPSPFFKNKLVLRYLTFDDFRVPENCSLHQTTKIHGISNAVLEKIISQIIS